MKKLPVDTDLYTSVDRLPFSRDDKERIRAFLDDADRENEGVEVKPA